MNRAADDEHTKEQLVALHREGYALEALSKVIDATGGSLDLYDLGGLCAAKESILKNA